jgi:hypothetical protein
LVSLVVVRAGLVRRGRDYPETSHFRGALPRHFVPMLNGGFRAMAA